MSYQLRAFCLLALLGCSLYGCAVPVSQMSKQSLQLSGPVSVDADARVTVVIGETRGTSKLTSAVVRDALDHYLVRQPSVNTVPALSILGEEFPSFDDAPLERQIRWLRAHNIRVIVKAVQRESAWRLEASTWPEKHVLWSHELGSTEPHYIWAQGPKWAAEISEVVTGQALPTLGVMPSEPIDWTALAVARMEPWAPIPSGSHVSLAEVRGHRCLMKLRTRYQRALVKLLEQAARWKARRSDRSGGYESRPRYLFGIASAKARRELDSECKAELQALSNGAPTDPWLLAYSGYASAIMAYPRTQEIAKASKLLPKSDALGAIQADISIRRALHFGDWADISSSKTMSDILTHRLPVAQHIFQAHSPRVVGGIDINALVRLAEGLDTPRWRMIHRAYGRQASTFVPERTVGRQRLLILSSASETEKHAIAEALSGQERDRSGWTRLHYAAEFGINPSWLERVDSAEANAKSVANRTPLHLAASNGHVGTVRALLARGASVDSRDMHGFTPLHWAAWRGHPAVVAELVNRGAALTARTTAWETPLHLAVLEGQLDAARMPLDLGAPLDTTDAEQWTPLSAAIHRSTHPGMEAKSLSMVNSLNIEPRMTDADRMLGLLNVFGSRAAERPPEGTKASLMVIRAMTSVPELNRAMHAAVDAKALPELKGLLQSNADVTSRFIDGKPPLVRAVKNASTEMISALAEKGRDWRDTYGRSLLDWALFETVERGIRKNLVSTLVTLGADLSSRGEGGDTALHRACRYTARFVAPLVAAGASVKIHNDSGLTPVHVAISSKYNSGRAIKALSEAKVSLDVPDKNGLTASYLAVTRFPRRLRYLVRYGAKGDVFSNAWSGNEKRLKSLLEADGSQARRLDPNGVSPLGFAIQRKGSREPPKLSIVQLLLRYGSDPNGRVGTEPLLHIAADKCQPEIVKTLVRSGAKADARNERKETALHIAIGSCSEASEIRKFMRAGIPVNAQDRDGNSALHLVAKMEDRALFQLLVKAGANIDLKNRRQQTPKSIWPDWNDKPSVKSSSGGRSKKAKSRRSGTGIGIAGGTYESEAAARPSTGNYGTREFGADNATGVRARHQLEYDLLPIEVTRKDEAIFSGAEWGHSLAKRLALLGASAESARSFGWLHELLTRRRPNGYAAAVRTEQNLGRILTVSGQPEAGAEHLRQALSLFVSKEALGKFGAAAKAYNRVRENYAMALERLGRLSEAGEILQDVLKWRTTKKEFFSRSSGCRRSKKCIGFRSIEDRIAMAVTQDRLALLFMDLGYFVKAERLWKSALTYVFERADRMTASLSNNLGVMLRLVGDHKGALGAFQVGADAISKLEALDSEDTGTTSLAGALLANRALQLIRSGKAEQGHRDLDAAELKISKDRVLEYAEFLVLRAWVAVDNASDARPRLTQAAKAVESAVSVNHPLQAEVAVITAELHLSEGKVEEAKTWAWRALALAESQDTPRIRWVSRRTLADVVNTVGQRRLAIALLKDAVRILETMKRQAGARKSTFLVDNAPTYRRLADWLIREGRLLEAEHVIGALKSEELSQWSRRTRSSSRPAVDIPLNDNEEELVRKFAAIREALVLRGQRYTKLRDKVNAKTITADERAELTSIRRELRTGRQMFASVTDALDITLRRERDRSPDVRKIRAIQGNLRRYGDGVVALHYMSTEKELHIILTTPEVQLAERVSVGHEQLNNLIANTREQLKDAEGFPDGGLEALYGHLIQPIEADLRASGAKTLLLSLDGALRYLPFAALPDGRGRLIERYELVRLTDATRDKLSVDSKRSVRAAGLGVSKPWPNFSALPSVPMELDRIIATSSDEPGVVPGVIHLDNSFHAEALHDVLDQKFPVVHIASHFKFVPGTHRDSFLLLGNGEHLTVEELRFDYSLSDVDLLTLSACNTGLSGQAGDGREVEGLGAMAQNLGARSVMATLWKVDDESTGVLMSRFYKGLQRGLTKAAALRRAQLSMIASQDNPSADYSAPNQWAPVVLMGNWH